MSANRWFVLMIAVTLTVVTVLTIQEGRATRTNGSVDNTLSDYWQRHPELSNPVTVPQLDTIGSDYYERHRADIIAARGVDTTDYAARHPELNASPALQADLTDYYFRHPELSRH